MSDKKDASDMNVTNKTINDKHPNFRVEGQLYLIRCYNCDPDVGRKNYPINVSAGVCTWCGWRDGE